MVLLYIVRKVDLRPLHDLLLELAHFRSISIEERADLENVRLELQAIVILTSLILMHMCAPVHIGQGRASLALKCRAIVHALALESKSPAMLEQLMFVRLHDCLFPDKQGGKAIASTREDPWKSAIYRILRRFEAVFQKGKLSIFGPKIISHVPHNEKGLYGHSESQRNRREKKH